MTREKAIDALGSAFAKLQCNNVIDDECKGNPNCACRKDGETILSALEAEGFMIVEGWKPIKTAPKDGTPVLLCDARTGSVRWAVWAQNPDHANDQFADILGWRDGTIEARGEIVGVEPTDWMPLPLPPLPKGEA